MVPLIKDHPNAGLLSQWRHPASHVSVLPPDLQHILPQPLVTASVWAEVSLDSPAIPDLINVCQELAGLQACVSLAITDTEHTAAALHGLGLPGEGCGVHQ